MTSRNVIVSINRPMSEVYKYAAEPANLHKWAKGLAGNPLELHEGNWVAESPMGKVSVDFTEPNSFGILDHVVHLPNGESVLNPLRVLGDGLDKSEVLFTIRQRDMTDEQFNSDEAAVQGDLQQLKANLES